MTDAIAVAIASTPIAAAISHDAIDRWIHDWIDKNIEKYLTLTDGPKDAITFDFRGEDFRRDILSAFKAEMT